jgi:hypothetical protein
MVLTDPRREPIPTPDPSHPHIPYLPRFRGRRCPHCPHIRLTQEGLLSHLSREHHSGRSSGKGPKTAAPPEPLPQIEVDCQRFFLGRQGSSFFQVTVKLSEQELAEQRRRQELNRNLPREDFVRLQVEEQMKKVQATLRPLESQIPDEEDGTAVSPWLELTRWLRYLKGCNFRTVARLARLPDWKTEPELYYITRSLARIIQAAYTSVCEDKINVFDQARINSFIRQCRAFDRPLMVKLQNRPGKRTFASGNVPSALRFAAGLSGEAVSPFHAPSVETFGPAPHLRGHGILTPCLYL